MLFSSALQHHPHELALSDTRQNRSWLQLYSQVLALRTWLRNEKDLKSDQHIALLIGNRVEFFEIMLGGIVSGLWVTPVNTHLSKDERLYILQDCDASLLFYDNEHADILEQNLPCEAINIETLSKHLLSTHPGMTWAVWAVWVAWA